MIVPAEGRIAFDSTEDLRFHISSRYIWKSGGSPNKSTHLRSPPRPNKVTPSFLWIRVNGKNRSHHPISMIDGWYPLIKSAKSAIIRISWCWDIVMIAIWRMFWELQRVSGITFQPQWVLCAHITTIDWISDCNSWNDWMVDNLFVSVHNITVYVLSICVTTASVSLEFTSLSFSG